ncbi:MAG TPA: hypothetical protein VLD35_07235 [Caldimonas sp.]|nr:hypothetical protein [Caldimonas sp.]
MNNSTSTFSTGTLDAWMRLPKSVRLLCALVAAVAVGWLFTAAIHAPPDAPALQSAASGPQPMRDPSVPDAAQALSTDPRQDAALTPTF